MILFQVRVETGGDGGREAGSKVEGEGGAQRYPRRYGLSVLRGPGRERGGHSATPGAYV